MVPTLRLLVGRFGLRLTIPVLAVGGAWLSGGCGIGLAAPDADVEAFDGPGINVDDLDASADGARGDAPYQDAAGYMGSPLCNATIGQGCFPDDPATPAECSQEGGEDAGDADIPIIEDDGGEAPGTLACHVRAEPGVALAERLQVCMVPGPGRDGDTCRFGMDCAAGYECVGGATGGRCQHYCCRNACDDVDGTPQFCDIQPVYEASHVMVPACLPVTPCELLQNQCPPKQTCSVVKSDGTRSCVDVGPRKVGESCETEHCGPNLVCLGHLGSRTCYQLCHADNPVECSKTEKCQVGPPLGYDPAIGICK